MQPMTSVDFAWHGGGDMFAASDAGGTIFVGTVSTATLSARAVCWRPLGPFRPRTRGPTRAHDHHVRSPLQHLTSAVRQVRMHPTMPSVVAAMHGREVTILDLSSQQVLIRAPPAAPSRGCRI